MGDDEQVVLNLMDRLHSLGLPPLTSIYDLPGVGVRYDAAVPALVEALHEVDGRNEKEGIARALAVPWAKAALPDLIAEFESVEDASGIGLRWVIGNSIEVTWDDRCFDDLVALATSASYGRAREMVVLGFRRSKRPEAAHVLVRLLGDEEVAGHAVKAITRLRVPEARTDLERLAVEDSRAWVRKAAKRALEKLDAD